MCSGAYYYSECNPSNTGIVVAIQTFSNLIFIISELPPIVVIQVSNSITTMQSRAYYLS